MLKKWCLVVAIVVTVCGVAFAQTNLEPKFGSQPKSAAMLAADQAFIAQMDAMHSGDRIKASSELSNLAWRYVRAGQSDTAMRRFNQSWLLNSRNGSALWGMAVLEMARERVDSGWQLFSEAAQAQSGDIDFLADYARTKAMVAGIRHDAQMAKEADALFADVHVRAPDHTLNLQNWAIAYFYREDYAAAWEKLLLAEKTPRARELDPRFVSDLTQKMPRPSR